MNKFIIENILKSIYIKKYNNVLHKIKLDKTKDIIDQIFLEQVKKEQYFSQKHNYFKLIKLKFPKTDDKNVPKLKSINNIIRAFIYDKLNEHNKTIPADVIYKIIEKVLDKYFQLLCS